MSNCSLFWLYKTTPYIIYVFTEHYKFDTSSHQWVSLWYTFRQIKMMLKLSSLFSAHISHMRKQITKRLFYLVNEDI